MSSAHSSRTIYAPSTYELRSHLAGELLELYRANPFLVLGLPSDATLAQAQKRLQKLNVLRQMGESKSDEFAVREAMQTLRDPQKRLLSELFWFQTTGAEIHTRAMSALRAGRWEEARDLWKQEYKSQKNTPSGMQALHNLAVLLHARVVARETGKNNIVGQLGGNKAMPPEHIHGWRDAFRAWGAYLNASSVWDFWRARAKVIADRRMGLDFVDQLRLLLPEVLLQVNRDLARRYADAGYGFAAGQHCQIIAHSGFDENITTSLCRSILDPVKMRVLSNCEKARETLQSCPDLKSFFVYDHGEKFEAAVRPDLSLLHQMDPKRIYGSLAARESAAQLLRIVVVWRFLRAAMRAGKRYYAKHCITPTRHCCATKSRNWLAMWDGFCRFGGWLRHAASYVAKHQTISQF